MSPEIITASVMKELILEAKSGEDPLQRKTTCAEIEAMFIMFFILGNFIGILTTPWSVNKIFDHPTFPFNSHSLILTLLLTTFNISARPSSPLRQLLDQTS